MTHHHHHHHGPDRGAPDCFDQIPVFSHVGRGIQGNSYKVDIQDEDSDCETHLEGSYYDAAEKLWHSDWVSENINGGKLMYQYNLRPYTMPRTFTITFIYKRPGRPEWSWTTPAIPYIWTIDEDGDRQEDPDAIVGSGVATLFVRAGKDKPWNERLHYPEGTTREDYNAPQAEEAWSATITFGKDGDVEIPNFDDLAKVLGITVEDIYNLIDGTEVNINGIDASSIVDYIDKCDKRDLDHLHKDLGFNSTGHAESGAFGGEDNVKDYIDKKTGEAAEAAGDANTKIKNLLNALGDLIYGVEFNEDGTIKTRPQGHYVPTGNINLISPTSGNAINTHAGEATGDVKAQ